MVAQAVESAHRHASVVHLPTHQQDYVSLNVHNIHFSMLIVSSMSASKSAKMVMVMKAIVHVSVHVRMRQ